MADEVHITLTLPLTKKQLSALAIAMGQVMKRDQPHGIAKHLAEIDDLIRKSASITNPKRAQASLELRDPDHLHAWVWFAGNKYKTPPLEELRAAMEIGIVPALDGCRVEPDGTCPHGFPSWLMALEIM